MKAHKKKNNRFNFTTIVANGLVILVAVIPILYLVKFKNVNDDIIAWGATSWIIAVLLKTIIYQMLIRRIAHQKLPINRVSLLNGLNSGILELGVALVFFYFLDLFSFLILWFVLTFPFS